MPGTSNSGGRNAKSKRDHALAGTGRKDRGTQTTATTSADAPEAPIGRPPIPLGLVGPALEEWQRMVIRLEAAKTLSIVDDAALYQYCCLYAETEAIVVAQRGTLALLVPLVAAVERWTRLVDRLEAAEVAKTVSAWLARTEVRSVSAARSPEARWTFASTRNAWAWPGWARHNWCASSSAASRSPTASAWSSRAARSGEPEPAAAALARAAASSSAARSPARAVAADSSNSLAASAWRPIVS